jgi:ribosomal protein S12 methylthiotransferase accessory factor
MTNALKVKKLILDLQKNINVHVTYISRWTDLPPMFQFVSYKQFKNGQQIAGVGSSLENKEKALYRSLGEFVERYSLRIFNKKELKRFKYSDVENKTIPFKEVMKFSEKQLKSRNLKGLIGREDDCFLFTMGRNLLNNKKVLIPAQLVYTPLHIREKILREPISTGAAASLSLKSSIVKGILEVVERDAFMVYYLNEELGYLLSNIERNPILRNIYNFIQKYNLEIYTFFLPTDIRVYNIMTIIIDRSGLAPAVNCGASSSVSLDEAIIKSIEEALQVCSWIRFAQYFENISHKDENYVIKKRGFYWSRIEKIPIVMKWIKKSKPIEYSRLKSYFKINFGKKFKNKNYLYNFLIQEIDKLNYSIYYKDITSPIFKKYGFKVVKVIIPQLQPLYLDERFKYLGGERIYKLLAKIGIKQSETTYKDLNKTPHFFL